MSLLRKMVRKAMAAIVELDYRMNPAREELIGMKVGAGHDDHDFTLIVNRYPK